jgi:site-specific DNA-methyltransferase (adenine-specific)
MSDVVLHLGDCLEYMRSMPDGSVDAVITDIPYGDINHIDRLHERAKYANGPIRNLHKGLADDITFSLDELLPEFDRIARQWVIVFAGDKSGQIRTYFSNRDCMTRMGVWVKTNPTPLHGQYIWLSSLEMLTIARKHHAIFNGWCDSPVWQYPTESDLQHPTQKPLKLMKSIIVNCTQTIGIIFDPFMGSGTTGVACVQLGRRFIGCEIDPGYFAIAQKRIAQAQLQPALFQVDAPKPTQDEMEL